MSHCKRGKGLIKVNGIPLELVQPEILRFKVFEPILLLGRARFAGVDMRIRVKGGGHVSQVYGARTTTTPTEPSNKHTRRQWRRRGGLAGDCAVAATSACSRTRLSSL